MEERLVLISPRFQYSPETITAPRQHGTLGSNSKWHTGVCEVSNPDFRDLKG